jgi:alanine racemase
MNALFAFPYMEVDLDIIKQNLLAICEKTGKEASQVIAVVKDSAYGLGAAAVSRALQNAGVCWFAVATIDEAVFLRSNGITQNILVLGMSDENCFEAAEQLNITLSIIDPTQIESVKKSQNIKWHLNIDTGMRRDGIMDSQINKNGKVLHELKEVKSLISGCFTHYHSSDSQSLESIILQQSKFRQALSLLRNEGFDFDIIHTSNSGACAYSHIAENEFIRPGVLLYGCRPDPSRNPEVDICEAVRVCSKVGSIREIKKGESVSYGHIWTSEKDTRIAAVPIGYADGFPRAITKTAFVIINDKKYPIVGRVTMDYIMVDIGDDDININDRVIIAGKSRGEEVIYIDELALNANTIGYELLCRFGGLMNHKYISNGQVISIHTHELF